MVRSINDSVGEEAPRHANAPDFVHVKYRDCERTRFASQIGAHKGRSAANAAAGSVAPPRGLRSFLSYVIIEQIIF